jgi:transposase
MVLTVDQKAKLDDFVEYIVQNKGKSIGKILKDYRDSVKIKKLSFGQRVRLAQENQRRADHTAGLSVQELSIKWGCGVNHVNRWLRRRGLLENKRG